MPEAAALGVAPLDHPTTALNCLVASDPAKLPRFISIVATKLYGAVDIDHAILIGGVRVTITPLKGVVDIDSTLLDRSIRVPGLGRCGSPQGYQQGGDRNLKSL